MTLLRGITLHKKIGCRVCNTGTHYAYLFFIFFCSVYINNPVTWKGVPVRYRAPYVKIVLFVMGCVTPE